MWFTDQEARSQQPPPSGIVLEPDPNLPDAEVVVNGEAISSDLIKLLETNGATRQQAIDTAVNEALKLQAAERLGLMPTDEEVAEYIGAYEERLGSVQEATRLEMEAILLAQGLPTENLAGDPRAFGLFRHAKAQADLLDFLQERLAASALSGTPVDSIETQSEIDSLRAGYSETAFLEAMNTAYLGLSAEVTRFTELEREKAEIIQFE